jgi:SPP1 family predicted phage head-tail adaptor
MAVPANSGDLRFRVRFDKQTETADPYGGTVSAWTEQFTRWADIRPMKGGEGVQAQRLVGTQPVLILVRYDSETKTIDPSWRAVEMLNDEPIRYYGLKTAEDMERQRQFITMIAEAGAADS